MRLLAAYGIHIDPCTNKVTNQPHEVLRVLQGPSDRRCGRGQVISPSWSPPSTSSTPPNALPRHRPLPTTPGRWRHDAACSRRRGTSGGGLVLPDETTGRSRPQTSRRPPEATSRVEDAAFGTALSLLDGDTAEPVRHGRSRSRERPDSPVDAVRITRSSRSCRVRRIRSTVSVSGCCLTTEDSSVSRRDRVG